MSLLKRYIFFEFLLLSICLVAFRGAVNSSVKSDWIVDYPDTLVQQKNQTEIFNWNDTTFSKGSKRIIKFYYDQSGSCSTYPCYRDCSEKFPNSCDSLSPMYCKNKCLYDTILHFLNKNKMVKVRLEFHMDLRGNQKFNDVVSSHRASGCLKEFKRLNVDTLRIKTVGMSSTKPIISFDTISKEMDKKKRNNLHRINDRVEIIID